ncbi:MAG: hypothetical protein AB7U65_10625 [Halothiobacillaceae bacterium]
MSKIEWEEEPTVDGEIIRAFIAAGKDENSPGVDIIHVLGTYHVAKDTGNLLRCLSESKEKDRPFSMTTRTGALARAGYENAEDLIGKRCVIYSSRQADMVAIEPPGGVDEAWPIVIWVAYH